MKTTLRTIACAIAWTGMACAYAAPQTATETTSVQVKVPAQYKPASGEFDEYAYVYQLDNGRRIKFMQRVARYFTELEGQGKTELFPQSPGVFLTAAGARIAFRDDGDTVDIMNYERLATHQKLPANTHIMAAR